MLMRSYMQRCQVPGTSLTFAREGKVLYAAGYGLADRSKEIAVRTTDRFRVASNSKAITAAAILLLVEQDRLRLNDTVFGKNGLLAHYSVNGPHRDWVETITVHHLLTHIGGGWGNQHDDPMFQSPGLSQSELIEWTLRTHPLAFQPGTHYAYSNFGYCVLGRVLEKISGAPYSEVIQRTILRPAGITDMEIASNRTARDEVHYYAIPGGVDPYGMPITRMDSHGGWIATPTDLTMFLSKLFAPQDGTSGGLLRAESLRIMTTGTAANPGYGCGLSLNKMGNAWHDGSLPGTGSMMVHTHGGTTWAVVMNLLNQSSTMLLELDKLMWTMARTEPTWRT